MTQLNRTLATALVIACAALSPAPARPQASSANLSAQEREMLALANDLSRKCSAVMEKWIASKEISEERLFSFLYYPIANTDPPKFSTDYDRFSDRDIQALEEAVMSKSSAIIYAVIVDKNGYIPTHNLKFSQPLTGNRAVDILNNRTKIIHNHQVGLTAGRSEAPFIFQQYKRDTGEVLPEVAVPVTVRGQHWGAIRIGYRPMDPS
jgi:methyl-accepting chemotaxis protein